MIEAKTIKKYSKRSVPWLLKRTQFYFNKFIRIRDEGKPCISCGSFNTRDASHFYSQGHYPTLRFNEDNVHLACMKCNNFLSGNLNNYRRRLPDRIGVDRLEKLDILSDIDKRFPHKWDRHSLIIKLEHYKEKCKNFDK